MIFINDLLRPCFCVYCLNFCFDPLPTCEHATLKVNGSCSVPPALWMLEHLQHHLEVVGGILKDIAEDFTEICHLIYHHSAQGDVSSPLLLLPHVLSYHSVYRFSPALSLITAVMVMVKSNLKAIDLQFTKDRGVVLQVVSRESEILSCQKFQILVSPVLDFSHFAVVIKF